MRLPFLAPLVAAIVMIGCDGDGGLLTPADPTPTSRPAATGSPTLGTAPTPASPAPLPLPTPLPTPPPFAVTHLIANTDGDGVAERNACRDDARTSAPGAGIPDAMAVQVLHGDCPGWARVVTEDGRQTWIRLRYLASVDPPVLPRAFVPDASWQDVAVALDEDGQACVAAALAGHGVGTDVLQRAVLADSFAEPAPAWLVAMAPCIGADLAAEVLVADVMETFGPASGPVLQCVRSFALELFAIDPSATVVGDPREASPDARPAFVALLDICLGDALARGLLQEAALPAGVTAESRVACVRDAMRPHLGDLFDAEPGVDHVTLVPTEMVDHDVRPDRYLRRPGLALTQFTAAVFGCVPEALWAVMYEGTVGRAPTLAELECITGKVPADAIDRVLAQDASVGVALTDAIEACEA